MIDLNDPMAMMYFPMFEGGSPAPAPKQVRHRPAVAESKPAEPPSVSTRGFSFPGPQTIISDVLEPTNQSQTLLQPDIPNPPVFSPPIVVPNIIQIASAAIPAVMEEPEAEDPPAEPPPPPKPEMKVEPKPAPKPPEPLPKPAEMPKPAPKPAELPKPEPKLPEPPQKPVDPPKPEPKPPQPASKPVSAVAPKAEPKIEPKATETANAAAPASSRDILSISPMPAPKAQRALIPAGEARGKFVISPEPNPNVSDAQPGTKSGVVAATSAAKIGIGNAKTGPAAKGAAKKAGQEVSAGSGSGAASAKAQITSPGGAGSGSGKGNGSGTGTAPARPKPAFSGITIVGGEYDPGDNTENPVVPAQRPLQTAYGLNVISTEDSGGGLPLFGVFSHEQIYTVYLDMRRVLEDQDPSWTLEFALLEQASESGEGFGAAGRSQGVVLPFPVVKEKPELPEAVVRRHLGGMIIVYGIVNVQGKLEQLSVKDSPSPQLIEPVLQAMKKWVFRPAQSQGRASAAKMLLGIPLWLPD